MANVARFEVVHSGDRSSRSIWVFGDDGITTHHSDDILFLTVFSTIPSGRAHKNEGYSNSEWDEMIRWLPTIVTLVNNLSAFCSVSRE